MQNRLRNIKRKLSNFDFNILESDLINLRCASGVASLIIAIALFLYGAQKPLTPILEEQENAAQSYDLDFRPLPNSWILNVLACSNVIIAIAQFGVATHTTSKLNSEKSSVSTPNPEGGVQDKLNNASVVSESKVIQPLVENPELWIILQGYLGEMPENLRRIYYLAVIKSGLYQGQERFLSPEEVVLTTKGEMTLSQVIVIFQQLEALKYGSCHNQGDTIVFSARDLEV